MKILEQDENGVKHVLKANPSFVGDVNYFGQSAIHIAVAVGNLRIVKIVLLYAEAEVLNLVDGSGPFGRYAIDYATEAQLHQGCIEENDTNCSGCKVLEELLQSQCSLYPSLLRSIFSTLTLAGRSEEASEAVKKTIILALKGRRGKLKDLAVRNLTPAEVRAFGLTESSVLDEAAGDVHKALESCSVLVPTPLRVLESVDGDAEDTDFQSLYTFVSEKSIASFAWAWVQRSRRRELSRTTTVTYELISYIKWLISRGAKFGEPLQKNFMLGKVDTAELTVAHHFMAYFVSCRSLSDWTGKLKLTLPRTISDVVFFENAVDSCRCGCSEAGCTPLTILLDGVLYEHEGVNYLGYRHRPTADYYISHATHLYRLVLALVGKRYRQNTTYSWTYRAVLRYLTFSALGISHSCCGMGRSQWFAESHISLEEANEIQQEQQEELLLLEDLLIEFEEKCGSNAAFTTFIENYWKPRMTAVLDDLHSRKLTMNERRAAEEVGVEWSSDEEENDEGDKPSKPLEREKDLEYWMGMLNEIVAEPKVDIPLAPGFGG
ncbi:hypothetical protein CCHL11_06627 [Colletotrichum chlorophyti]|uniref:Uncharacterized protein n=1 Tax=Colletotrichum chlorophyti TaxID=708187 RepID=A0A1Q8RXZ6_9PEZI|nr:hypothetical protein CCHL11_06627 [Colletotrichum chlorophyti]